MAPVQNFQMADNKTIGALISHWLPRAQPFCSTVVNWTNPPFCAKSNKTYQNAQYLIPAIYTRLHTPQTTALFLDPETLQPCLLIPKIRSNGMKHAQKMLHKKNPVKNKCWAYADAVPLQSSSLLDFHSVEEFLMEGVFTLMEGFLRSEITLHSRDPSSSSTRMTSSGIQ